MGTDTRDRILEAATRLFHERGFAATSVATILREAGVKSGSLYHFFGSKEALLVAAVERHLDELERTVLAPAERASDDPFGRVFALLEHYRRRLVMTGCTLGCPVGDLALEVGSGRPEARALIARYFALWTAGVRRWLEAAGDRLPEDADRGTLARLVLSVMEGGLMQAQAAGTPEPFEAAVAQLRAHFQLLASRARRARGEENGPPQAAAQEAVGSDAEAGEWRSW
ncbi:MAG: TetR/AcrR family transcriptional regulator [Gemmatimonadota bacterium]